jgi:hypothetical protein
MFGDVETARRLIFDVAFTAFLAEERLYGVAEERDPRRQ